MRSFLLNKLVRDKVYDNIIELGQTPHSKKLDDAAFLEELKKKLLEEANEIDPQDPKVSEELADLLEVIEAIGKAIDLKFDDLRKIQTDRKQERGSFENRQYIGRLDLSEDDPWAAYYAKDLKRFPEIRN